MSLTKQLFNIEKKFTPADPVSWTRVETLVHGPGTSDDGNLYKRGDGNSAVFACLMAIATAVAEAPKRVYRTDADGNDELVPDSPLQALIDSPTPGGELTPEELDFWVAWALHTAGDAYLLKVRSGKADTGNVVQLWPVSPSMMEPVTERDSGDFISYYKRQIGPNKFERVPIANVVHYRLGIDDKDMRHGLSPLKRLLRQIATDQEADKYTESLLKNYAVPGLVVIPSPAAGVIDESMARKITESFERKFKSDNRGKTAVLSREATIQQFGFTPEQMDIAALHRLPEERIAAVLGVPPIVAQLGAGLERATYSNFREAREMFTETKLVPLWRMLAARLNASLLPDFHGSDKSIFVAHDLTNVRALQEDEDNKYRRLNLGVLGKWITVNEARADIGLPSIEGGDELSQPVPEQLRPFQDDEPDDKAWRVVNVYNTGGANGHDAPFPDESYP